MKPEEWEKHVQSTLKRVQIAMEQGWDIIFESPSGSLHDLSVANMECLDRIEKEELFLYN